MDTFSLLCLDNTINSYLGALAIIIFQPPHLLSSLNLDLRLARISNVLRLLAVIYSLYVDQIRAHRPKRTDYQFPEAVEVVF